MTRLTLEKVLEVEKHGLSYSKSAYLLGVCTDNLWRFCKKHGVTWSGKCANRQAGEMVKSSLAQRARDNGVSPKLYRLRVARGWSEHAALNTPVRKREAPGAL